MRPVRSGRLRPLAGMAGGAPVTSARPPAPSEAPVPEDAWPLLEVAAGVARAALDADAVTVALRQHGGERLLVSTREGIREAVGSVSLGLVEEGPTALSGGTGILQAAECAPLFGFIPTGYLGARFATGGTTGGIAAWSGRDRHWAPSESETLAMLADLCRRIVGWAGAILDDRSAARLLRVLPDLVLEVDAEWTIRYASEGGAAVLGLPSRRLVGKPLVRIIHPNDRTAVEEALTAAAASGAIAAPPLEFRIQRAAGDWAYFETRPVAVTTDEKAPHCALALRESTAPRRSDEAMY